MKTKRTRKHPALDREHSVLYVEDVMDILGIGQTKAYQIIRKLNDEIEAAGYFRPVGGRVSEAYFRERFYLNQNTIDINPQSKRMPRTAAAKA